MPSDWRIREEAGRLEVESLVPPGRRVFFALGGLVPLLGPWQLLIEPRWKTWLHPFFFFALLISLGALAVSAAFFLAAFAGLASRWTFDAGAKTFTVTWWAPVLRARSRVYAWADVREVSVATHPWSEGPDTYSVEVETADGRRHQTGSSSARAEAERLRERIRERLARAA